MAKNSPSQEKIQTSKVDDSQLHWFWRITTKHYFFPFYYIGLTLLLAIMFGYGGIFPLLIGMPIGLTYLIALPLEGLHQQKLINSDFAAILAVSFHLIYTTGIFTINIYKKKGILLKWLIITLFLLATLSFVGCAGIILSDSLPPFG